MPGGPNSPLMRVRRREREREPFWLKYRTFAWGLVTPPCIGGEARGCLGAVPSRELPSPFSAVLEQHVRCHFAFRKAARVWPAILEKGKCAALQP